MRCFDMWKQRYSTEQYCDQIDTLIQMVSNHSNDEIKSKTVESVELLKDKFWHRS